MITEENKIVIRQELMDDYRYSTGEKDYGMSQWVKRGNILICWDNWHSTEVEINLCEYVEHHILSSIAKQALVNMRI